MNKAARAVFAAVLLLVVALLPAAASLAESDYTYFPESEAYVGEWTADGYDLTIAHMAEDYNQFTCTVTQRTGEGEGLRWVYDGCAYDDVGCALASMEVGEKVAVTFAGDDVVPAGEPIYTDGAARFALNEDGTLTWTDFKEVPGEDERVFTRVITAPEAILARGVLRVGSTGDYNPMSYLDPETGAYVGFDAELAEDLAAAMGVSLEYVPTSWPTLTDDTLAGRFDLAICGITVTDARKEVALMSDGYLGNGKTILCRAEDAERFTGLDAINRPDVRVMVNPGGLNEKFALENLPDCTLIVYDVNQEIPALVAEGEADVMITEIMEAGYYVGRDDRLAAPLIFEPFTRGQLGALMPRGSEDLLAFVNDFLAQERASGRLDALAETYIYRDLGAEGALPDAA